jgi:hypothetical protein
MKKEKQDPGKQSRISKERLKEEDRKKKIEEICDLYSSGSFTIESCCTEIGITARTFWNWCDQNSEFAESYKKAKERAAKINKEGIREKAVDNLTKLITGFWIEETEKEEFVSKSGDVSGKRIKTKRKFIPPNVTAVIFALKNTDPANWNESLSVDLSAENQIFKIGDQVIHFS